MNNVTYIGNSVPSTYTALSVGSNYSSDPTVYGNVDPFVFKHNEIIEIVINNLHTNLHPFHLHGHKFQVLQRTFPQTGTWPGYTNHSQTPVRRDTVMLENQAFAVIRFKADNPGVWAFHCHVEFHVSSGFSATFIEAPEVFTQKGYLNVPQGHIDVCKAYPQKYEGNAAGNTQNPLDLSGAPDSVLTSPKE